jgi:hypothetical protein
MEEYDRYLGVKKPAVGLDVREGAGLPDLSDRRFGLAMCVAPRNNNSTSLDRQTGFRGRPH